MRPTKRSGVQFIMRRCKKGRALAGMLHREIRGYERSHSACVTCSRAKSPAKNRRSASVQRTAQRADPVSGVEIDCLEGDGVDLNFASIRATQGGPRSVWPGRAQISSVSTCAPAGLCASFSLRSGQS